MMSKFITALSFVWTVAAILSAFTFWGYAKGELRKDADADVGNAVVTAWLCAVLAIPSVSWLIARYFL